MAIATLRNRVSTEFKKVEKDSDEYLELQAMRDPNDGRPVWEETGIHDAVEQSKRLEAGKARPWDVGDEHQPVAVIAGVSQGYAPASSVFEPTPSEVAAGAEPEEGPLFGIGGAPETEVPLVPGVMEGPSDTDVSGTDSEVAEQVEEAREPKSGSSGRKRRKKSDEEQPSA